MTARITAMVSGHWLRGSLRLSGVRIQDALNDSSTDFCELTDVEVHYSPTDGECLATLPEVVVPKAKLELLFGSATQHEAPDKRWNCHSKKTVQHAFAIVGGYNLSGEVHMASATPDSRFAFTHHFRRFFSLTEAVLRSRSSDPLEVPLLFANKDFVSCIQIGELDPAARPHPEPTLTANQADDRDELDGMIENVRGLLDELNAHKQPMNATPAPH